MTTIKSKEKEIKTTGSSQDALIPLGFCCPVTGRPMSNPYTRKKGEMDKESEAYLVSETYDEMTIFADSRLPQTGWLKNLALKNEIEVFLKRYPQLKDTTKIQRLSQIKLKDDLDIFKEILEKIDGQHTREAVSDAKENLSSGLQEKFHKLSDISSPRAQQPEKNKEPLPDSAQVTTSSTESQKADHEDVDIEVPFLVASRHSYNKEKTMEWFFMGKMTNPITGQKLKTTFLIANTALATAIESFPRIMAQLKEQEALFKKAEDIANALLILPKSKPDFKKEHEAFPNNINFENGERDLHQGFIQDALDSFKSAADEDVYPPAYLRLLQIYAIPKFKDPVQFERCLQQLLSKGSWFRTEAMKGNPKALFYLGTYYRFLYARDMSAKNPGILWILLATQQGYADTQFELAIGYRNGDGVLKDEKEAMSWYRAAAETNNANAKHNLGVCYQNGMGVPKDLKEAVRLYRSAAEQGYAESQFNLGLCYQYGLGVLKGMKEAVRWYRTAIEQGHAMAQYNLGHCYQNGIEIAKDTKEAARLYLASAKQGCVNAQNNLGVCYQYGVGVKEDMKEAVRWYRAAAEKNHVNAKHNLGVCYENGIGVPKDMKEALRFYRAAAEQGHGLAKNDLGRCYEKGIEVPKDMKEAVRWYHAAAAAAEQDNSIAQYNLGVCYAKGMGVKKDEKEAVRWYHASAENGYFMAQNNLGICYTNGMGVEKDEKEAVRWYRAAAKQGDVIAQNNLGICYTKGIGVEKDEKEAVRWYRAAAQQGHPEAISLILHLDNNEKPESVPATASISSNPYRIKFDEKTSSPSKNSKEKTDSLDEIPSFTVSSNIL